MTAREIEVQEGSIIIGPEVDGKRKLTGIGTAVHGEDWTEELEVGDEKTFSNFSTAVTISLADDEHPA